MMTSESSQRLLDRESQPRKLLKAVQFCTRMFPWTILGPTSFSRASPHAGSIGYLACSLDGASGSRITTCSRSKAARVDASTPHPSTCSNAMASDSLLAHEAKLNGLGMLAREGRYG